MEAINQHEKEAIAASRCKRLLDGELACATKPFYQDELVTLYHGDFREVLPSLDIQVPLIVTDPPYPKEFIPLYGDLARLAKDTLTEGGSLLAMCGQSYLPEIIQLMTPHLKYQWTISYLTPGAHLQVWQRKVMTGWKPVLWFVAGDYNGKWTYDVAKSQADDKRFHHWGQSTSGMIDLLLRSSNEGDTVLDPFAGGGATLKACKMLGLPSIGIELEESKCETIATRLTQVAPARPGQAQLEFAV